MNRFDIKVYKTGPWVNNLELFIYDNHGQGSAKPIEFEKRELGEMGEPALYIDYMSAQGLMDSLWDCGIRPSEGAGSAGAMKATQDHLKDMRKLVSHLMKTDL